MYVTAETRWFFRGDIPRELQHWFFETAGPSRLCKPFEAREDFYLRIPRCAHIGAKLRAGSEGNLEIKIRDASIREHQPLFRDCSGRIEIWRKLTIEYPAIASGDTPASVDGPWISVYKSRSQRKYSVVDGIAIPVSIDENVAAGCEIELTALLLHDTHWWTFGFEAFAKNCETEDLIAVLQRVVLLATKDFPNYRLDADNSYGYPTWLDRNA